MEFGAWYRMEYMAQEGKMTDCVRNTVIRQMGIHMCVGYSAGGHNVLLSYLCSGVPGHACFVAHGACGMTGTRQDGH